MTMGGKLSNKTRKGHFEEEIETTVLSLQKKLNRNLGKLVTALQKLDNYTNARIASCDDSRLVDRDVYQKWRMSWGSLTDIFPLRPEPPHDIIELQDFSDHPEPPIVPALSEEHQLPVQPPTKSASRTPTTHPITYSACSTRGTSASRTSASLPITSRATQQSD